jgi:hypothetical protein
MLSNRTLSWILHPCSTLFEAKTYHKKADDLLEKIINEDLEIIDRTEHEVVVKIGTDLVHIWINEYPDYYGYVWKLNGKRFVSIYEPCTVVKKKFKKWLSTKPTVDPLFKVMKD